MSELISTRIPREISEDIDKISKRMGTGKTIVLREIIIKGLEDMKLEYSLELFKKRKVTLWKAASLAGVSLWKMIEILKDRGIPQVIYTIDDAKEDLRKVFGK